MSRARDVADLYQVVSSIDTFKITEASITGSGNAISSAAYSNTFYTPVSGVVTVSSDVFSFSQTGVYVFSYIINLEDWDAERHISFVLYSTTDGSTPTSSSTEILRNRSSNSDVGVSNATCHTVSGSNYFNITSTSIKILPYGSTAGSTQSISSQDNLFSFFQFVKIDESI